MTRIVRGRGRGRALAAAACGVAMAAAALAGAGPAIARPGHAAAQVAAAWQAAGPIGAGPLARLDGRAQPDAGQIIIVLTGRFKLLETTYCNSRRDCWAVGEQRVSTTSGIVNQMLHWNGASWHQVKVPNPGGTAAAAFNALDEVRCTSGRNCWAVGSYTKGSATLNQALHWNGHRWYAVRTPAPAGTGSGAINNLFGLTCVSAGNCWAVGEFGHDTGSDLMLSQVLHWNGAKWSRLRVPSKAGTKAHHFSALYTVRCLSSRNCLAVGSAGTNSETGPASDQSLHWNGHRWALVRTPSPVSTTTARNDALDGLGCASSGTCWAVGQTGPAGSTSNSFNQILRWNGKKWIRTKSPQPDGTGSAAANALFWVTCVSKSDCWGVGALGSIGSGGTGTIRNQALHWNGRRWALVHTPNPGGTANGDTSVLFGARCAASDECWAVGLKEPKAGSLTNEILRWNGKKWSVWS
jgi:hypothetical protein